MEYLTEKQTDQCTNCIEGQFAALHHELGRATKCFLCAPIHRLLKDRQERQDYLELPRTPEVK